MDDFTLALERFKQSNPYQVSGKRSSKEPDYYVVTPSPIPVELALIAGDAFHNMRSALDHLVHALVRSNGGQIGKGTGFPIFNAPPPNRDTKREFEKKIEGIQPAARDLIYGMQPFRSGDETLWLLHRLDITDKQRLLLTVGKWSAIILSVKIPS